MTKRMTRRRGIDHAGKCLLLTGAIVFATGVGVGIGLSGHSTAHNNFQNPEFIVMRTAPMDANMQRQVYDIAKTYNLDWSLLMAIIEQESRFVPDAISPTGDYGLMQINRINHSHLSVTLGIHDFLNPYDNVRAGAFMLRDLFDKYGDVHQVLMAYHMGETGASELWAQGIYETGYSRSVLRIQQELIANQEISA